MNRPVFVFALAVFAVSFVGYSHTARVCFNDRYSDTFRLPRFDKPGFDFTLATNWVKQMRADNPGSIMYPPAAATSFLPFLPFKYPGNYRAFTFLVIASLFFAIFLTLMEGRSLDERSVLIFSIGILAVVYGSWWFQLELERGNSNTFVSMLCAGGFLALSRDRPMIAALFFAEATQLRIYPAILIVFVFLRAGIRPVLRFVVLNVAALFFAGLANLEAFVRAILFWQKQTINFDDSHSLASAGYFYGFGEHVTAVKMALIFIFFAAAFLFWRERRRTGRPGARAPLSVAEASLVGLAFQLMDLLPNVSWDYKLGIQTIPFLLFVTRREWRKVCAPSVWMALVGSVAVAYGFVCATGWLPKVPAHLINVIAYTAAFLISYRKPVSHRLPEIHPSALPFVPSESAVSTAS